MLVPLLQEVVDVAIELREIVHVVRERVHAHHDGGALPRAGEWSVTACRPIRVASRCASVIIGARASKAEDCTVTQPRTVSAASMRKGFQSVLIPTAVITEHAATSGKP